ncbi:PadR family transcriptional regulator [Phenylobacterium sp. VNQ135]|uniref:PadR family transcriptional regulator n=1 Tax=Phenylobacterium sp. VNQ135 TaxID=3400922 RepID=UPI003BFDAA55
MFGHHRHHHSRHGWGGRWGDGRAEARDGAHGERGRGRGARMGRFFEHGDLRFVILALLEEQPRHGYELIKELEERTGGAYRPSPGVIYPTLALLEDEGSVRPAAGETGRKLYEITDQGREALTQNRAGVEAVFARMNAAAETSGPSRPRVGRAMMNLGMALRTRLSRATTPEELDRIIELIDDTARAIEKI